MKTINALYRDNGPLRRHKIYLLLDTSMFKQLSNGESYLVPESKELYNAIQNDHTFFKYTSIRIQSGKEEKTSTK